MFNVLFIQADDSITTQPESYDRKKSYVERVNANAENNIGPWLAMNIMKDSSKRARNFGFEFNLDLPFLIDLWHKQGGRCAISNLKMQTESGSRSQKNPYRASLDRIDNSKGYVKDNVRFVTHWVNNAKSTWTDPIFEEFVRACNK